MRAPLLLALVLLTSASMTGLEAQTPEQIADATRALRWRTIGPTIMGGRVADLAVVESDPLPPLPPNWREPRMSARFVFTWYPR